MSKIPVLVNELLTARARALSPADRREFAREVMAWGGAFIYVTEGPRAASEAAFQTADALVGRRGA